MFNRRLITSHKKTFEKIREKHTATALSRYYFLYSKIVIARNRYTEPYRLQPDNSTSISLLAISRDEQNHTHTHHKKKTNSNFFLFPSVFIRQCERLFSRFHSSFALWVINLPTTQTNFVRFFSLNPLYGLIWFCFGCVFFWNEFGHFGEFLNISGSIKCTKVEFFLFLFSTNVKTIEHHKKLAI